MRAARRPIGPRGFTLIEIGVALAVVALLMAAVVPSIEGALGIRGREAAGQIAALVRYVYAHAALTGKSCRIVFQMDEGAYWAECTAERFTLEREKVRARGGRAIAEERRRESFRPSGTEQEEAEAIRARIEKEAEFAEFTDNEVTKKALPDNVSVAVWTAHQTERFDKGAAHLHFFPQGFTEKAHIYVQSAGDTYTLVVAPLTGKVKVVAEELPVPRE